MARPSLSADKMAPEIHDFMAGFHRDVVDAVATAVARDRIVVVGMAQNPYCKRARKQLDGDGVTYTYLEYGSYLSKWRERLALKIWAGFPTFPMVFVEGTLIGGNTELQKLREAGKLPK